MIEIPESMAIAKQLNETVQGKKICRVIANASPHKFAFYHGDPAGYYTLLTGQAIGESIGMGAIIEISAGDRRIVLGDGTNLCYYDDSSKTSKHHQLLLEFNDRSVMICSIQMYGTVLAFMEGTCDNKYYLIAKEKPSPLSNDFDKEYFDSLYTEALGKLSAKAFLATEQRIPGLGNGVLQDILFHAGIHPKRKMKSVKQKEYTALFHAIKDTLAEMTRLGGRDTEKDLFGKAGEYQTILSKNTVGRPCPVCGSAIQKTSYLGGAIYWCPDCQQLDE